MAPKKVKAKDKKGVAKEQSVVVLPISEKEQYLQKEDAFLTEQINNYTQRMEHFQEQNELLDKEAQEIRQNSKAYLAYLAKLNLRCQDSVVTLNDQNHSDLGQVQKQKEDLLSQYMDKEKEVKCQLAEMEIKFSHMNKEIMALQPFKDLQSTQQARIRELEKELLAVKIQHSEHMHKVKTRFLLQKTEYELESQEKVEALAKKAEKEAVRCLIQHTKQIKAENWQLRTELLSLIQRAQNLKALKHQLLEQREQLLRELWYSQDLACMRPWLTQRGAPTGSPSRNSFRCNPSAKNKPQSHQAISALPPLEKDPGIPTRIPQAAKSFSQARMAKASGEVPLAPAAKDSSEHT